MNTTLNTFELFSIRHVVKNHSDGQRGNPRKEIFYLTTHSTHFIYGFMASDIWIRTILIVRKETRCHHIGYYFRLTARVHLYAPSHRQEGNPKSPLYELLFLVSSIDLLHVLYHKQDSIYPAFARPFVEHWLEKEKNSMGPP